MKRKHEKQGRNSICQALTSTNHSLLWKKGVLIKQHVNPSHQAVSDSAIHITRCTSAVSICDVPEIQPFTLLPTWFPMDNALLANCSSRYSSTSPGVKSHQVGINPHCGTGSHWGFCCCSTSDLTPKDLISSHMQQRFSSQHHTPEQPLDDLCFGRASDKDQTDLLWAVSTSGIQHRIYGSNNMFRSGTLAHYF